MVDLNLAIDMQDIAEIQRKIGAAQHGSDHGSDDGDDGYDDDVPTRKRRRDDVDWHEVHRVLRTKTLISFLTYRSGESD